MWHQFGQDSCVPELSDCLFGKHKKNFKGKWVGVSGYITPNVVCSKREVKGENSDRVNKSGRTWGKRAGSVWQKVLKKMWKSFDQSNTVLTAVMTSGQDSVNSDQLLSSGTPQSFHSWPTSHATEWLEFASARLVGVLIKDFFFFFFKKIFMNSDLNKKIQ